MKRIVILCLFYAFVIPLPALAQAAPNNCFKEEDLNITVYGEIHGSANAFNNYKKQLDLAKKSKILLLLEFMYPAVNFDYELKKEQLSYLIRKDQIHQKHLENTFGIESLDIKVVDVFGAAYLCLKNNPQNCLRQRGLLFSALTEPSIKTEILADMTIDDLDAKQIKNKLASATSDGALIDVLIDSYMNDLDHLTLLMKLMYQKSITVAENKGLTVNSVALDDFTEDSVQLIINGLKYRDQFMVNSIKKISCEKNRKIDDVVVIVGKLHMENIATKLKLILNKAKVSTIDISN